MINESWVIYIFLHNIDFFLFVYQNLQKIPLITLFYIINIYIYIYIYNFFYFNNIAVEIFKLIYNLHS